MSKHDTTDDDERSFPVGRRDFMKAGAVGAVAAGLGSGLTSLTSTARADGSRTRLVEHTGDWRPSTCAGCTSWCSAQILVDDQTNRVIRTRGNEESKVHGSNDCPRQDMAIQQLYDPDRITQPMRRTNPKKGKGVDPEFEPVSWAEAIGEIADRIMDLREREETEKFMLTRGRTPTSDRSSTTTCRRSSARRTTSLTARSARRPRSSGRCTPKASGATASTT